MVGCRSGSWSFILVVCCLNLKLLFTLRFSGLVIWIIVLALVVGVPDMYLLGVLQLAVVLILCM